MARPSIWRLRALTRQTLPSTAPLLWANNFNRLQRCYERNEDVIDAFFDLADAIITLRRLIREAWTLYRWAGRPVRRP